MRRSVRGWINVLAAVTVVAVMAAFVAVRVIQSSRSLDAALLRQHAAEASIVVITSMLAVVALAGGWATLLRSMSPGVTAGRARLMAIFSYTWPGRYVPGTLPFLAARVYMASRAGYGKRAPTIATGFQSALEVLVSVAFGAIAFSFAREGAGSPISWAVAGAVVTLTAIAIHPGVFAGLSSTARRILRRGPALHDTALPPRRAILASVASVLACNALVTAGVAATAGVFTDVSVGDAATIAAAVSLSGVAGVLVVLAPAGLGVRDGALAALLVTIMPLETAASVAIAYRALTVFSDLLLAALAIAGDRIVAWTPAALPARADQAPVEQRA